MESAQLYAETKRKSGTVLYIQKLPCICFKDDKKSIVITEINSSNPLYGYNPYHTKNIKNNKNYSEMNPEIGRFLEKTALSFHPASSFWAKNPSFENSIIALSANRSLILEDLKVNKLDTYKSMSFGSDAYLYWEKIDSLIKGSAVSSIYRKFVKISPEYP